MKRLIISVWIILGSSLLFCQTLPEVEVAKTEKKHGLTFSYSPPFALLMRKEQALDYDSYTNGPFSKEKRFGTVLGEFGVKGVYYYYQSLGVFSAAYGWDIHPRLTLALNASYQCIRRKWDLYIDADSPHFFTERFHQFQIMQELQFNYYKKKGTSIFMSAAVGVDYLFNTRGKYREVITYVEKTTLAYQLWLFGVHAQLDENWMLRLCAGYGTKGICEIGVGWNFF